MTKVDKSALEITSIAATAALLSCNPWKLNTSVPLSSTVTGKWRLTAVNLCSPAEHAAQPIHETNKNKSKLLYLMS